MKFFAVLVLLESACLCYAQESSSLPEETGRLTAYETKIFHKIPEHTIVEEKIGGRKTTIVLEEKSEKVEEKPTTVEEKSEKVDEKWSLPSYEFGYGVKDPISGDHKDQWEKRLGDHVKGAYRFDESDGTQRVVEYEADGKRGFEATVKNVERKEALAATEQEEPASIGLKVDKVAHSYSYLKRISP